MLLPHMVCNALVAGGRLLGVEQQAVSGVREVVRLSSVRGEGNCATVSRSRTISLTPDA